MPWTLTTPVDVGDLDPAGSYTQVKIVSQLQRSTRGLIRLNLEYGNTVDDEWVPGINPIGKDVSIDISGEDYATLVSTASPEEGELTYDAVKRALYTYCADNDYIAPGTLT